MVIATWFFLAIFLSTATQLRISEFLGVGELFGFASIFSSFLVLHKAPYVSRMCFSVMALFGMFLFSLTVGWLINIFFGFSPTEQVRDFVAILYAASLATCLMTFSKGWVDAEKVISYAYLLAVFCQVLLFASFLLGVNQPFIQPWYTEFEIGDELEGIRFQGWANNPNQLGFLVAPAFFIAGNLAKRRPYVGAVAILSCITVEILIRSTAVAFGWIAGLFFVVFFHTFNRRRRNLGTLVLRGGFVVAAVCLVFLLPALISAGINKTSEADANGRFPLWANAVTGWANSLLFGFGPGAHSGADAPFESYEAHNIVLDLLLQGGLVGLVPVLLMFVVSFRCAYKRENYWFCGLVVCLFFEGFAHNMIRHPVFWIALLLPMFKVAVLAPVDGSSWNAG